MEQNRWHHENGSQLWIYQRGQIRLGVVHDLKRGYYVEVVDLSQQRWVQIGDGQGHIRYWATVESAKRNAERWGLNPEWRRLNLGEEQSAQSQAN